MREKISLSYRVEGRGEPLLLVHGFGISFNIWSKLNPLLNHHFSLVMIEMPGIGATQMPPEGEDYLETCIAGIKRLREELGITRWIVLGYSTGSRIAEAYVRADAEHVSGAIFLCPLTIGAVRRRLVRLGISLDRRIPAFGTWLLSGWRLKFLISWLGFNLKRDPMLEDWYAEIGSAPVRVLKETIRVMAAAAERGFDVPVPYAMIWGDRDLIPEGPLRLGEHDHFVHGRHAAPVESAGEIASFVLALEGKSRQVNR